MANKSTNTSLGLNKRVDGHLLGYFRSSFIAGAGSSISVFQRIYYAFTSPGSISLTTPNPLGFAWVNSSDAVVRIITISPGQSGNNALFPGSPSGPNSTGSGAGGSSGTIRVLVSESVSPYGSSIPITVGNVPPNGVGIGSTFGGDRGGPPSYPTSGPGIAGSSFLIPSLSPYTQYFPDYSFSSTGGAGGNTTYYAGPFGSGGGGGAGGLVITATGSPTPTLSVAPVTPVNASNGNPGGGPTPNGRTGGAGGTGGSGFGAGGGGGGGPVEDFGNNSPGGTGGGGAGGIVLVVVEGTIAL